MADVRPSLRQRHAEQTHDAIVQAALELFAVHGFAATTVEEIASRAQVAPRTFFRYFPTKESVLFGDLVERLYLLDEVIAGRPLDEPPLVSLVTAFRELSDGLPGDSQRLELVQRLANEEPDLLVQQRAILLDRAEEHLIELFAARTGVSTDDVGLRVTVATALACAGVAMRTHTSDPGGRCVDDLFVEALRSCADALAPFR